MTEVDLGRAVRALANEVTNRQRRSLGVRYGTVTATSAGPPPTITVDGRSMRFIDTGAASPGIGDRVVLFVDGPARVALGGLSPGLVGPTFLGIIEANATALAFGYPETFGWQRDFAYSAFRTTPLGDPAAATADNVLQVQFFTFPPDSSTPGVHIGTSPVSTFLYTDSAFHWYAAAIDDQLDDSLVVAHADSSTGADPGPDEIEFWRNSVLINTDDLNDAAYNQVATLHYDGEATPPSLHWSPFDQVYYLAVYGRQGTNARITVLDPITLAPTSTVNLPGTTLHINGIRPETVALDPTGGLWISVSSVLGDKVFHMSAAGTVVEATVLASIGVQGTRSGGFDSVSATGVLYAAGLRNTSPFDIVNWRAEVDGGGSSITVTTDPEGLRQESAFIDTSPLTVTRTHCRPELDGSACLTWYRRNNDTYIFNVPSRD
jgi:hypothetical protein